MEHEYLKLEDDLEDAPLLNSAASSNLKSGLRANLISISTEGYTEVDADDSRVKGLYDAVPNMWAKENIGLYCQYAAAGLLYGSAGTLLPFCVYVYKGETSVCSNSSNITFFAWNFKLIFAVIVDCWHPFGYRRKSWFLIGYAFVLALLLVLAIACDRMTTSQWLGTLLVIQLFLMFATVPADGYSIELGQLEPPHQKGQILITGQRIFFIFCVVAGVIQTLLINGPSTNDPDCPIAWTSCWSWGLSPNSYYGVLFIIVAILAAPMLLLRERQPSTPVAPHTFTFLLRETWLTMHNLTTLYILIFVIGIGALTNFTSQVNLFLQYYIIALTNVQSGIDNITTYAALVLAVYVFQTYLMDKSWRQTQRYAVSFSAALGLLWIPAYYNLGGLRNAWYTIFIDLDQAFVTGLTQVIYSLAVMELAKPGQEATTYELIVTVGNAASAMSGVIATQLLAPFRVVGCVSSDDDTSSSQCGADTVNLHSPAAFQNSNGPQRYTIYCIALIAITITCTFIFTPFLPENKAECCEWRRFGEQHPSRYRPYLTGFLCVVVVLYGFVATILLLNPSTSCLPAIGGEGC